MNTDFVVIGTTYTCEVNSGLNPGITEITEITEIHGNHLPGRSNLDVEAFQTLSMEAFRMMPTGIERFFPNLLLLQFFSGILSSVSSEDLSAWPNLTMFSAQRNKIEILDGDLFQNAPQLKWIDLSSNLIQNVGTNLLSNLNELTYISFIDNPCINSFANTPQEIENLKSQLLTQCPPLTTEAPNTTVTVPSTTDVVSSTTVDPCIPRCSINEETDELRLRIEELEAIVRELVANPCLCTS